MRIVRAAVAVAVATAAMAFMPPSASASTVPALDHVFVIVMENHSYPEIIGSSSAPYINSLVAKGSLGAAYRAVTHPSLPNYLSLSAASTFSITSDCTTCWVSATNIADRVESAGKSWKAYMESMPSPCFIGDSSPYAQKHDPFIYFNDIRTNASRCQAHILPFTQLATDLRSTTTTPNFAWITPNMCNDMHDCSVAQGDAWLKSQVPAILGSPAFTADNSLLAITWDEDDSSASNQVPVILLGSGVHAGYRSGTAYSHYSLVRTIETALGLSTMTSADAGASAMDDMFAAGCAMTAGVSAQPSATMFPVSASSGCAFSSFQVSQYDSTLGEGWFTVAGASSGVAADAYGYAGHAYEIRVRGVTGGVAGPWSPAVTATVASNAAPSHPFSGLYTLDAYGGVRPDDSPPLDGTVYWAGWKIARAAHKQPGAAAPEGGLVLDGYGGLHAYGGGISSVTISAYWSGWDIARDFAFLPSGTGGYVLDGYGGLHPFSVNGAAMPPNADGGPYWSGWDIARNVAVFDDGTGGDILDGWGGVHTFGITKAAALSPSVTAYWQGWNIARGLDLVPGTHSGYVLDGYGGVHAFGPVGAIPAAVTVNAYWKGWDIARAVWLLTASTAAAPAGYVLDGFGGPHQFGGAPPIANYQYSSGADVARSLWGA